MRTVLCAIGTRPEAIKMAPVVRALQRRSDRFRPVVVVTGQHRELVDAALADFEVRSDHDLNLMTPGQTLASLTAALLPAIDGLIREVRPDWVLAQGDTTSVLAASLAAFYNGVPFGHVEAGLRTGDLRRPFPEELNRVVADRVADLLFAPTDRARRTLLAEGVPDDRIVVTGNTGIDALLDMAGRPHDPSRGPLRDLPADRRWVLMTAHRRESFGPPFRELCGAVRDLAQAFGPLGTQFVYPVHPNPNVRRPVFELLGDVPGVSLIDPLNYRDMIAAMQRSALILTDSGGLQEEAPALGVPVLVLRETTERPEGVEAGMARLVGTARSSIVAEASRLLGDPSSLAAFAESARKPNPYGDGRAADRIVEALEARPGRASEFPIGGDRAVVPPSRRDYLAR